MRYWVQSRDQTFIKGYGSLSFADKMGKNIDKEKQNFLIMLNNLQQMHLKLVQKKLY